MDRSPRRKQRLNAPPANPATSNPELSTRRGSADKLKRWPVLNGVLAMPQTIAFTVNGRQQSVTTDPDRPLLDVLREDLGLTGCKFGCGEHQCGACTVLVNDRPTFSCTTRVATVANHSIETIEGLSVGD